MELSAEQLGGGITRIRLAGRMDVQGTATIETRFTAHAVGDGKAVVVDLSGVSFLASIGIRALILSAKALQQRGGKMALARPDELVRKVLETAGVDTIIPVCASLEDACAAVTA